MRYRIRSLPLDGRNARKRRNVLRVIREQLRQVKQKTL